MSRKLILTLAAGVVAAAGLLALGSTGWAANAVSIDTIASTSNPTIKSEHSTSGSDFVDFTGRIGALPFPVSSQGSQTNATATWSGGPQYSLLIQMTCTDNNLYQFPQTSFSTVTLLNPEAFVRCPAGRNAHASLNFAFP